MKKFSTSKLADILINKRKEKNLTQAKLAEITSINRAMISRIESCDYKPSIDQLETLSQVLDFDIGDLFEENHEDEISKIIDKKYKIAVAGTGYVGMSIATLLAQHNEVTSVDIDRKSVV